VCSVYSVVQSPRMFTTENTEHTGWYSKPYQWQWVEISGSNSGAFSATHAVTPSMRRPTRTLP